MVLIQNWCYLKNDNKFVTKGEWPIFSKVANISNNWPIVSFAAPITSSKQWCRCIFGTFIFNIMRFINKNMCAAKIRDSCTIKIITKDSMFEIDDIVIFSFYK